MQWPIMALAHYRKEFWRDVVSHDLNCRLLSCDLTWAECLGTLRFFRKLDTRLPPTLLAAAQIVSAHDPSIEAWLRKRAAHHQAWSSLWYYAEWDVAGVATAAASPRETALAERLIDTFNELLRRRGPWSVCGLMTALLWLDGSVAGSFRDVLADIYGAPRTVIAPLSARLMISVESIQELDETLRQATNRMALRNYFLGLRYGVPILVAILDAACTAGDDTMRTLGRQNSADPHEPCVSMDLVTAPPGRGMSSDNRTLGILS